MVIFISKYCFILGKVGHMTNCNRSFVPARHGTIGHVTNLVKDITFKKMFHIPGYQLITFYTFLQKWKERKIQFHHFAFCFSCEICAKYQRITDLFFKRHLKLIEPSVQATHYISNLEIIQVEWW